MLEENSFEAHNSRSPSHCRIARCADDYDLKKKHGIASWSIKKNLRFHSDLRDLVKIGTVLHAKAKVSVSIFYCIELNTGDGPAGFSVATDRPNRSVAVLTRFPSHPLLFRISGRRLLPSFLRERTSRVRRCRARWRRENDRGSHFRPASPRISLPPPQGPSAHPSGQAPF